MKLRVTISIPNWLDKFLVFPLLLYRQLRYEHPYRRIRLTDVSGVATAKSEGKFTLVDPADFYWLNNFVWLTSGRDGNLYAARVVRSPSGRLNTIFMHREIFFTSPQEKRGTGSESVSDEVPVPFFPGQINNLLVDHRNTNSLDNRRFNLRLATPSQNSCNSRRDKSNTLSRYRGVSFSKRKNKWFSAIRANGKKLWLGYFDSEYDAARAYDTAAKKFHGDFAQLNFVG